MLMMFRSVLTIVLSISLVLTGAPFASIGTAHAQETRQNVEGLSPDAEMERSLEELRKAFTADGKVEAHLDPFLLTRQTVLDDRQDRIQALMAEERILDFVERVQYLEGQIAELNDLERQVQERMATVNLQEPDKVNELELIRQDIVSRRGLIQVELADLNQHDPRNPEAKPLEVDLRIDEQITKRHYWGRRLRLILESENSVQGEIRQSDFRNSLSPRFNHEGSAIPESGPVTFTLANHRGVALHRFLNPIAGATFFGEFLVFVEAAAEGETARGHLPVRFIDLRYARPNLGNAPLPVFTMPLRLDQGETQRQLIHENGYLKVGAHRISHQQLTMLSQVHQVLFNVNVALVDPASYENARPLMREVLDFFRLSMEAQGESFRAEMDRAIDSTDFLRNLSQTLETRDFVAPENSQSLIEKGLADGQLSEEEYRDIQRALNANTALKESNQAVANGRRFMTRMRLMMQYLIEPRVEGAPTLLQSMVMIIRPKADDERSRAWSYLRESRVYRMAKYGSWVAGALVAGDFLPEPYKINIYKSLDLISAMNQHFQGYLSHIDYGRAYVHLAQDAFVTSTTGWTYFIQAYFADGQWAKFLYGLSQVLLVPLKLFASIHFSVNGYKMFRQTLRVRSLSAGELSFFASFKEAARQDSRAYWESLAEAEKKSSGSDVSQISEDEVKLLEDHIQRLRHGREGLQSIERDLQSGRYGTQSSLKVFTESLVGYVKVFRFGSWASQAFQAVASRLSLGGGEDSVRTALSRAFLSYSSLRSTFKMNATVWNYLFMVRSYFWAPHKYFIFLMYPNYFKAAVTTVEGRQHFPSVYNAGLESWPQKLQRMISQTGLGEKISGFRLGQNFMVSAEALRNLRAFEQAVIPLETAAIEMAMTKAQMALIENIRDPERLRVIFDSAQREGAVSTGIRNLNDPKLKDLTNQERVFYRAYFTRSFDLTMQRMLSDITTTELPGEMDPVRFARAFRQQMVREGFNAQFTEYDLAALKERVNQQIDFQEVRDWSNRVAHGGAQFLRRAELNFRHSLLQTMHPGNYQVGRFLTVRRKVEEPRAMERAMRMEVSSLISGIPIGILATLALYAGVDTGLLRPFDPSGVNTETHFNYMSRYLFYNGFVPGLILGMLANTWMKVQEDNRIDELGGFDKEIRFSDGKRGFWRNYFTNMFANPVNKWKANQLYSLRLITANIPAAAVTLIVFNLYGLGRIDVGALLSGYVIIYTMFLTGFGMKIGQAFELTSKWVNNKIPRHLRAHPAAQRYINGNLQKRKILFSYVESLWGIIVTENVAGDMVTMKDNAVYGTRAFLRLVFGGDTPTEIIVRFTETMSAALRGIPGAESALDGLRTLVSNNYEAFDRFPDRLPPLDGMPQVTENPDLPRHRLGELLGKLGGMVATLGGVTALPYAVTDFMQRWREARLQIQAEDAVRRQEARAAVPAGGLRCQQIFAAP